MNPVYNLYTEFYLFLLINPSPILKALDEKDKTKRTGRLNVRSFDLLEME